MLQAVCLVILVWMAPIFGGFETLIMGESDGPNQQVPLSGQDSSQQRREAIQKASGVVSRNVDKDVVWRQAYFNQWMGRNSEEPSAYLGFYHQYGNPVTYSLPEVVEKVLGQMSLHPEQRIMVVWDVDDTLVHSGGNYTKAEDYADSIPLHPEVNLLLSTMHQLGVDMILVTAGRFTDFKLSGANICMGLFSHTIESVGYEGAAASKGEAVREYLESMSDDQRPDHLFFVDDQAWGHCQNGFVEQVSSVGKLGITVLQHNEAHFFRDRNNSVNYDENTDVEDGKLTSEPGG